MVCCYGSVRWKETGPELPHRWVFEDEKDEGAVMEDLEILWVQEGKIVWMRRNSLVILGLLGDRSIAAPVERQAEDIGRHFGQKKSGVTWLWRSMPDGNTRLDGKEQRNGV